jgi:hypothetical protein
MSSTASSSPLRPALEEASRNFLESLQPLIEREISGHVSEAENRGRTETAERLNQAARRIRQADGIDEVAAMLVDAATVFCDGAALFRIAQDTAFGVRISGVEAARASQFAGLPVPLSKAAALGGAVQTKDPVVAMSTAAEVSPAMLGVAGQPDGGRVWIFPLVVGEGVDAILYCWGAVQNAPIELLAQVAGLCLAAAKPKAQAAVAAGDLVAIEPLSVPRKEKPRRPDWDELSPQEQQLHLRAQRFARVEVAAMRLQQAEDVHSGRRHRDLYGSLRESVDAAREKFRREFVGACPSMIDYLHVELLRTLAHENPGLLGSDYPGPLI